MGEIRRKLAWLKQTYRSHGFHFATNKNGDWDGLAFSFLTVDIEQKEGEAIHPIQDGQNIDQSQIRVDLTGIIENGAVAGCNGDSDGYGNGTCYSVGSVYRNGRSWKAGIVYFQDIEGSYCKNDRHFIEAYIRLNNDSNGKGWLRRHKILV